MMCCYLNVHFQGERVKQKLTAAEKFRSIAVPLLACLTVLAERKLLKISTLVCCKINCDVMKWR